jgi:archaellum component FlaC
MTEVGQFMKVVERIESKVDDIRDKIHDMDIRTSGTMIRQTAQEKEISDLKSEVEELKTAYHKAAGAWKLLSIPGLVSFIYAVSQILTK